MLDGQQHSDARANLALAWAHMLQAAAGLRPEEEALKEWDAAMSAFGPPIAVCTGEAFSRRRPYLDLSPALGQVVYQ